MVNKSKNIKLKFKTGDHIIVIAGNDKGKTGKILKVDRKSMRVLVEGVNIKTTHQKPNNASEGGILKIEKSIHISNVSHVLDGKPAKTKYVIGNESKELVFKSNEKAVRS